ncbi:MAG: AAA family ATPase [Subdoligranulum sp.]|nr:AAA family ATPase [Subdoligranulum sp.]
MQKLNTVDAETLLYQPLEKPGFVVDGLIPTGLSLFCGAQKIGKSWLMLKLCLCVSEGRPLWELTTTPGDVLYLCLEDTFYRIQDRLFRLTDKAGEASERLHFAVASCKLTDGLVNQLEEYLKEHPGTRLIVIDTLQKVRTASKDNAYANDYGDISLLKEFADRHTLTVVVVHHIRKQGDSDVFNRVSGTTGLTGSADATFVLEKEHRASDTATLYAIGRDIEYQEFTLRFRDCSWELVERKSQEQLAAAEVPPILFRLVAFMKERREWSGTATELLAQMEETDTAPNIITKLLNEYHATVLRQNNIRYAYQRTKVGRRIVLSRGDGVDSGDG